MSIISGTPNWMSEDGKPKAKKKEVSVKKEPEFNDTKKLKIVESLLKKAMDLETEVNQTYKIWPTSEMSTISTLVHSIKFNIKKIKPSTE